MRLSDVQANYDRLAPIYDLVDRWFVEPYAGIRSLRRDSVERLALREGDCVLDIGCGTGLNFALLVQAVGPSGRVVGLDYSDGMLAQAQNRVTAKGWRNVDLIQGDAAELDVDGGPFDAVVSTWALGIVDDLPRALERAVDVLAPGARLAVLDLDRARASGGVRRLLAPLIRFLLRLSGVDSEQDLDDERLRKRWAEGKAILRRRLVQVGEESNVGGSGFLIWGTAK